MAFRKKFIRRKRFARKKRGVKRRTFKRYTKKRIVRRKRITRRTRVGINKSLDVARFKIRVNKTLQDLGDDPEIIHLGNTADLTFAALSGNLPILTNYNQWRIDKVVTHWRMRQKHKAEWFGDLVNHALVYNVPNDVNSADGSLEKLMFNTDNDFMNNVLQNYTQLRGVKFRKVSYKGGKYTYRPFVTEYVNTYSKTSTGAPILAADIRRNYAPIMRYASSTVRYEAPIFMMCPGLTKKVMDYTGAIGSGEVSVRGSVSDFPALEIWSDIYVTCKQYKNFSTLTEPNVARLPDQEANEIDLDFNKVKADVQHGIMDHIVNTNPILGAVAAVAGLRKRPRDEFKM